MRATIPPVLRWRKVTAKQAVEWKPRRFQRRGKSRSPIDVRRRDLPPRCGVSPGRAARVSGFPFRSLSIRQTPRGLLEAQG